MKNSRVKCKQCGNCCLVFNPETKEYEPCKYLCRYVNGYPFTKTLTRCLIYKHRLGCIVGDGQCCVPMRQVPYDFPDCPYNKGKPLHPYYKQKLNEKP